MLINVKINSMKDAEHFSNIVRRYPAEITLKADKFCVDPKSALGVLAMAGLKHFEKPDGSASWKGLLCAAGCTLAVATG